MVTTDFMKVIKPLKLSIENHPSLLELPSPSCNGVAMNCVPTFLEAASPLV